MAHGRILVADDDDVLRETLAEILELEGYTVQTAGDGTQAIFQITQSPPDLVLLDMRMPLLDGAGFMRELGKWGVDVPILVMTAAEDVSYAADAFRADGFLGKPFQLDELLPAVERLCTPRAA
jgi:two-component system, OmpR family, response regulator MprA